MVNKRVGVRLVAENGERVKAELEGIGDAGEKSFGRIDAKAKAVSRAVTIALAAAAAAAAAAAGAMIRDGLKVVDAQAKMAASLGTTVESMQVLERAGDLAGVSMGQVEQASMQLTRRLSQAAGGAGPAVKALERLGLSAKDLIDLPLDKRIETIQDAIENLVPASERAAVASQFFGDRAGLVFSRIDTATLRQATKDVHDFGVVVSDQDAAQIERTNDAVSRLGLIWRGVSNQLAVAVAPSLEAVADGLAAIASRSGPLGQAIKLVFDNLGRLTTYATTFAAFMATRWVWAFVAARMGTVNLVGALTLLRGAIVRTGIGALIVGAGELIYWFSRLVSATGGFGEALKLLGEVAAGVWDGIVIAAQAIPPGMNAVWHQVQAQFYLMLGQIGAAWNDFLSTFEKPAWTVTIGGKTHELIGGLDLSKWRADIDATNAAAGRLQDRATDLREEAGRLATEGFDKAKDAVARLAEVVTGAGAESEDALSGTQDAADRVGDALDNAGDKGSKAGKKIKEAAEEAKVGWEKTVETLAEYAASASDLAGSIGDSIVGAFRGAENAIVEFVKTGKLNFSDMITSFIADLARLAVRHFILGPIAGALSGIFAGPSNPFAFLGGPSFEGGGHTGHGPRVGGLDGKGGYLAMVHPRERIIDETRSGGRGGGGREVPVIVNINTPNAESFRQSRTQVAADIQRAVSMGRRGM